ncbi:CHAT domain-containing protein [Actinomadura algeriensis]|uniref:Tetratricopeptide (TPR) repeat protein n=1 Tax=Actinomadura algeriensis TaxID=1679523 RepID=A0ABR9K2W6_9ACTN|nr:CHAT domain-containing protein [Actinomadura algeriensis]MBE1537058.1 tetratricopeptide (TPR) repeat protein [Actinomadura algeriensis]
MTDAPDFEFLLLEPRARHAAAPAGTDAARAAARDIAFLLAGRHSLLGTPDDLPEMIERAEEALGGPDEGRHVELRCLAAEARAERWISAYDAGKTPGTGDLDRAIEHLTAALDAGEGTAFHEEIVRELGTALFRRAEALPEDPAERRKYIDRSVVHLRTARDLAPDDAPDLLFMLGLCFVYRLEEGRARPGEREEAIGCLTAVWDDLPPGDELGPDIAMDIGDLHYDAYLDTDAEEREEEVAALTRAIEWCRRAVDEPSGYARFRLGTALSRRHLLGAGEPGDGDTARRLLTDVLPELPREAAAFAHRELGDLAMSRATARPGASGRTDERADEQASDPTDEQAAEIAEACGRYRAAFLADGSPDWNGSIHALIADALFQFSPAQPGSIDDVREPLHHASTAWRLLGPGPERRGTGYQLFSLLFSVLQDLLAPDLPADLLDLVVEVCGEVGPEFDEDMRRADDDAVRAEFGAFHGMMLAQRGDRRNDPGDLGAAGPVLDAAYELADLDDPEQELGVLLLSGGYAFLATNFQGPTSTARAKDLLRRLLRSDPDDLDVRFVLALVLGVETTVDQDLTLLREAVREVELLHADLPVGDGRRERLLQLLAPLYDGLAGRTGRVDHAEKAQRFREELGRLNERSDAYSDDARTGLMAVNALSGALSEASGGKRSSVMRDRLDKADSLLRRMPADSPLRKTIGAYRQMASWTRAGQSSDGDTFRDISARLTELSGHLQETGPDHPYQAMLRMQFAAELARLGNVTSDMSLITHAMEYIPDLPTEADKEDMTQLLSQSGGVMVTYAGWSISRDPAWLRDCLRRIEWLVEQPGLPPVYRLGLKILCAVVRRDMGDRAVSRELVLAALRQVGQLVLLQSTSDDALVSVRQIGSLQQVYGRWFVDDNDPRGLVAFLEHTRGLVLHAATSVTDIPHLLEEAGRDDLAEQWRASPHGAPPGAPRDPAAWPENVEPTAELLMTGALSGLGFDDDLRDRVIDALAAAPAAARLFTAPDIAELAGALTETGADALVYLVPPVEGRPGAVVMLTAGGAVEWIPAPHFTAGPMRVLDHYADEQRAYLDLLGTPAGDSNDDADAAEERKEALRTAVQRVERALGQLCDWAWFAVLREVVPAARRLRPDGAAPRVVLVPVGRLGMVPWHAARRVPRDGGAPHYALHDLAISYAATGRQLADVARRPSRPLVEAPVIVSPEFGDLLWGWFECAELRERFYPGAVVYGQDAEGTSGHGTPQKLQKHFPGPDRAGASLVHTGCHAVALPDQPTQSYLQPVRGSEQVLRISTLLGDARGRDPRAPGGTIVLASCTSDLTRADHDEALTLATGFLTLGAATVLGTRWAVSDRYSAMLSIRLHELLAEGRPPRDALREAQLWMIDGACGPGGPADPALRAAADEVDAGSGLRAHDIMSWAGFTHQGR